MLRQNKIDSIPIRAGLGFGWVSVETTSTNAHTSKFYLSMLCEQLLCPATQASLHSKMTTVVIESSVPNPTRISSPDAYFCIIDQLEML